MGIRGKMAALQRIRSIMFNRNFSTSTSNWMSGGEVHKGGYKIWKNLFFLAAVPIIIIGNVNAFGLAEEEERQEFVECEHMRIRSKKFPWGDGNHSLFHNKHLNALPNGYEE